MKWYAGTLRRSVSTCVATVLMTVYSPGHAATVSPQDAGTNAANQALGKFGSKEGVKQNIGTPLTNSSVQMKTIDGNTSFTAASGTPASNQFLQILIHPSGTGDLDQVIVSQDLDSNGLFDTTLDFAALGVPVSGVCANGLISCTPGTWDNCQSYKWDSETTGALKIVPTTQNQLGGCYCINSSCGSSLVWSNSSIVLKDLGAGAVAAIHAQDASTVISDVRTDVVTITYYGQLLKKSATAKNAVTSVATLPSLPQQQSYYTNWPQLNSDSSMVPLTQGGNSDSLYYKMMNSAATQGSSTIKNCSIIRNGVVTTTPTATYSGTGNSTVCTDHLLFFMMKQVSGGVELKYVDSGKFGLNDTHHECWDDPGGDGWHLLKSVNTPSTTAAVQVNMTKSLFNVTNMKGPVINFGGPINLCTTGGTAATAQFDTAMQASMSCPASGAQTVSFDWAYIFEYSTDSYQESVNDSCSALDTTCTLQDETVDSVVTKRNFNLTGLNPLPISKTFTAAGPPMVITKPWWRKDRTYVCQNQQPFDLSAAKERYGTVVSTSTDTGSTLNYTDSLKDANGNWVHTPSSLTKPDIPASANCEKVCRVRKPKIDTQAGITNTGQSIVMSNDRDTSVSYVDMYKTCTNGGLVCPVETGEVLQDDCLCTNQFGAAATVMQLLRLSGKDSICSSGTPVAP